MKTEEMISMISDIEREIALLPKGSISRKTIRGSDYFYHRVSIDGKRTETYVPFAELDMLRDRINRRKELEKRLKEYRKRLETDPQMRKVISESKRVGEQFHTLVRTGGLLNAQISVTEKYRKRECFSVLRDYVFGETADKVFILYGLRRTGKTTMIRQALNELDDAQFEKAAFIQIRSGDTLAELDADIRMLEQKGYKYLFIDEVTLLEDFIEGAAVFADVYACSGMKIVLSGTDSLGFAFTKGEQLYDRCVMLHTTFIPYREFEEVLGIRGIDEYIRYGGTMSLSGTPYNDVISIFSSAASTEEYIDTAIARNIQHSLKMYEYGGHFRALLDLYERGELTNVINRVIENMNHRFTKAVVEQTFRSHDISVMTANLLKDREQPIDLKRHVDIDTLTAGIKRVLDIIDREEQNVAVDDSHMTQIREYLLLLDLINEVDLAYFPETGRHDKLTVLTQPGMRYAQAEAIVENLLMDTGFSELGIRERKTVILRLLDEIRGRMTEEIVLLETKLAKPDKKVFKLQFAIGEFDMVVFDPHDLNCEIYEIKHSKERDPRQCRHLLDEEKCSLTTHRYGDIIGKYVIYRGEDVEENGVHYRNVENFLLHVND